MSPHLYHPPSDDPVPSAPCPLCEGDNTVGTEERAGERQYYCADCEHRWSVDTTPSNERSDAPSNACETDS